MRILHWDEMFHPSFGYQINVLAKFQAKQGHEVIIMTSENIENHPTFSGFGNKENIPQEDDLYSKRYGVEIIRLPIYKVVSGRVIYKKGYIKRIKDLNPDIIMCHTNDTLSAINIVRRYKLINIPIVFDNHMLEMASKNPLSKLFRIYFRLFITPKIIEHKWTVIRTQDDNYVNKCLGIPKSQTPFISFGSDTTLFHPDMNVRKQFREKYGIKQNDFVVVYTGKLNEAKGGKLLAQAFEKKLSNFKYENITLIAVGNSSGEYGKEVEKIFENSENNIIRIPTQKYVELAKFYQAADLCVFPKQCSLSFYDAQACGLPVVSEDNNINVDRLQYENGVNFKAENIQDFREKITLYANMDKKQYEEIKENALEFIKDNYDYENIAYEYSEIILKEYERQKSTLNQ